MNFGCQQVCCISVEERSDKRKLVSDTLKHLNIDFIYHIVKKDKENVTRGCFTSHINVIRNAYNKGIDRLMVFEDDIEYKGSLKPQIESIKKFLDKEKWDIFFLGGTPNIWSSNIHKVNGYNNIYKGNFAAAHAYIINRSYMEKIKDLVWDGKKYSTIDVDVLMKNNNSYITYPRIFHQRVIENDRDIPTPVLALRSIADKAVVYYSENINIRLKIIFIIFVLILIFFVVYKFRK